MLHITPSISSRTFAYGLHGKYVVLQRQIASQNLPCTASSEALPITTGSIR